MYQILRNRTTVHIDGIPERSKGSEFTYAVSACSALSRSYSFERKAQHDRIGDALKSATLTAKINNLKLCRNCAGAAQALLDIEIATAELDAELYIREAAARNAADDEAAKDTVALVAADVHAPVPHSPANLNQVRQPRQDGPAYLAGRKSGEYAVTVNGGDWLKLGVLLDQSPHKPGPSAWWAWDLGRRAAILDHLRDVALGLD